MSPFGAMSGIELRDAQRGSHDDGPPHSMESTANAFLISVGRQPSGPVWMRGKPVTGTAGARDPAVYPGISSPGAYPVTFKPSRPEDRDR